MISLKFCPNCGNEITDDDVYREFNDFYNNASNGVDMLKDKNTKNYRSWGKRQYLSLARRNPIKFLNKSAGEFFIKREGCELALADELEDYIHLETFKKHFKDIIEYRTLYYYKTRGLK